MALRGDIGTTLNLLITHFKIASLAHLQSLISGNIVLRIKRMISRLYFTGKVPDWALMIDIATTANRLP